MILPCPLPLKLNRLGTGGRGGGYWLPLGTLLIPPKNPVQEERRNWLQVLLVAYAIKPPVKLKSAPLLLVKECSSSAGNKCLRVSNAFFCTVFLLSWQPSELLNNWYPKRYWFDVCLNLSTHKIRHAFKSALSLRMFALTVSANNPIKLFRHKTRQLPVVAFGLIHD